MRSLALMGFLLLAGCGHHGDDSGTCEEVASAAATKCGATFNEADCTNECNGHQHPEGHLGSTRDSVESAADCNAALQVLADEAICN